jgi:hypothetical protein
MDTVGMTSPPTHNRLSFNSDMPSGWRQASRKSDGEFVSRSIEIRATVAALPIASGRRSSVVVHPVSLVVFPNRSSRLDDAPRRFLENQIILDALPRIDSFGKMRVASGIFNEVAHGGLFFPVFPARFQICNE